jgi:UDP-galactopyranose mutase
VTDTPFTDPAPDPSPDLSTPAPEIVIIGAGPAGLTGAYVLSRRGVAATVLEADTVVGGISRTAECDGWRFDIGGHRFFTKVQAVEDLWFEILGPDDFLRRPRQSRIYYRGKFYDYPIVATNALRNLGPVEAMRCMASYAWVRVKPPKDRTTLEGFVASRFGWRLYEHFFKTQSEKVWGVPCREIQADWGAQRIKDLSLVRAVIEALKPKSVRRRQSKAKQVTSLIEEFNYPKYGPGMMWERCAEIIAARGTKVMFDSLVTAVHHRGGRAVAITAETEGVPTRYECTHVLSSMPIGALIRAMDPPAPADVVAAANALRYRDFITVALVVPEADGFPDNWIYINDANVKVGRIQNFGRWSPYLVKDGRTCLGLELFVNEGDEWWTMSDEALIAEGARELDAIGLVARDKVEAGYVVRMPKAYPMYDGSYKENVDILRRWLEEQTPNVFAVGRNGMHKYNNQDHSMYTAMLAVENMFGAEHDIWTVNVEAAYHEEYSDGRADGAAASGSHSK